MCVLVVRNGEGILLHAASGSDIAPKLGNFHSLSVFLRLSNAIKKSKEYVPKLPDLCSLLDLV